MVNKRITAAKRVDSQEPVIVACSVGHVHQPPQCHYKQHLCHVHALAQCRAREAVCILCKYTFSQLISARVWTNDGRVTDNNRQITNVMHDNGIIIDMTDRMSH